MSFEKRENELKNEFDKLVFLRGKNADDLEVIAVCTRYAKLLFEMFLTGVSMHEIYEKSKAFVRQEQTGKRRKRVCNGAWLRIEYHFPTRMLLSYANRVENPESVRYATRRKRNGTNVRVLP